MEQKKYRCKVLLLGDSTVGKTCYLSRLVEDKFRDDQRTTIGIDFRNKEIINENGETFTVQVWDTAGQERFRAITKTYYKGADGILVLFDVTSKLSFENVREWVEQVNKKVNDQVIIYLIGTKIDLGEDRSVDKEEAEKLAQELGLKYFETSAKNNINIIESFESLIKELEEPVKSKKRVVEIEIKKDEKHPKKKCC